MTILDNSLLSFLFLGFNLAGLLFFLLSQRNKKFRFAFYGLIIHALVCLLYFFISYLNGDIFILSRPEDFTANLIYFIFLLGILANTVFGLKIYYQHRLTLPNTTQLGIFFSAILLLTQLSDSAYQWYQARKIVDKTEAIRKFNQTEDFELQIDSTKVADSSSLR